MTGESSAVAAGSEAGENAIRHSIESFDRERVVAGAGGLALVAVTLQSLVDALYNLPFDPVVVPAPVRGLLAVGTPVVLALALVVAALASGMPTVRVGLLFAGVFGLLAVLSDAATLPAVVAITCGGALALAGGLGVPSSYREGRRAAVAVVLLAGIVISLASATAVVDGLRGLGGTVVLAGIAALGVRSDGDRVALGAGVLAALAVVVASATAPFVLGSALLVSFAVVGAPHLFVALAGGGAIAAIVAGIRRGEQTLAIGAALLLLAGVPATIPRATAIVLGAGLALLDVERVFSRTHTTEVTP